MSDEGKRLIWFYGRECPHCKKLHPVVDQWEAQSGQTITRLEVWHDDKNAQLMRKYSEVISAACGGDLGVPAFYNEGTGKAICGSRVDGEKLTSWAKG
jgi:thiol-disulfide isomerase/thioredoxin